MIAHIVLFQLKPDLTYDEHRTLVEAFRRGLREIPSIRRSRVGRRVIHGRPYEQSMRDQYQYVAVLDFEDVAALEAYLNHPAHQALAQRFFAAFQAALMYDYEVYDGEEGLDAML